MRKFKNEFKILKLLTRIFLIITLIMVSIDFINTPNWIYSIVGWIMLVLCIYWTGNYLFKQIRKLLN